MAEKITTDVLGADGARRGESGLDAATFGIEPNVAVMHQVVTAQLAAGRAGTHSTLTRAEARGGGRKPWRQKGLGRARQGSIRSPQWVGGGVAHGPKPRNYRQRTPKKMRRLALRSALSARAAEGQIKVVDSFDWTEPKTKQAKAFLAGAGIDGKVLLVLSRADSVVERSFRNLPQVIIVEPGQLSAYAVLWAETVVFTGATLAAIEGGSYEVSESDFVREDANGEGGEGS